MDAMALIQRELAKPMTHVVLTTYADGATRKFEARGAAAAESYAVGERRKIGRELLSRAGGKVTVASVEVLPLA